MVSQEGLNLCFEKLTFFGGETKINGGLAITEWKDIPMELLLRIVSLGDDRTVIVASGVCTGGEMLCLGELPISLYLGFSSTLTSLFRCKNNMNNLVLSVAPKFTKLQTLVLRRDKPHLEDNTVETIAKYCPDLQDLDLSKSFKLSDRALYALSRGCPNLIRLNISGCSAFSDTALANLAASCRKLKYLNLCGCGRAASDKALKVIGYNCNQLQFLILGWCENVGDAGVMSLAYGCPDLRALDLCGCVLITDESIIALANNCRHLRSLGLYFCQNITDRAMYSLAQSGVKKNKHRGGWWGVPSKNRIYGSDQAGLMNLNISQCTALTPPAVQAVCDSFPLLHTCPGRHSLIISGCLNLTSVHCACAVQAHRVANSFPYPAH